MVFEEGESSLRSLSVLLWDYSWPASSVWLPGFQHKLEIPGHIIHYRCLLVQEHEPTVTT